MLRTDRMRCLSRVAVLPDADPPFRQLWRLTYVKNW